MELYNIQSTIIIFGLKYFYLWTICVFFFLYEYDVIIREFMFLINNFFIQYNSNCSPVYFRPVPHKNCSPVHFRTSPHTNWSPVHFRPVPARTVVPFISVPSPTRTVVPFISVASPTRTVVPFNFYVYSLLRLLWWLRLLMFFFSSARFVFHMIDHRFRCVQFRGS